MSIAPPPPVSSATLIEAAGGTVPRPLGSWLGDMSNVKSLGVMGDGIRFNGVVTVASGALNILNISNGAFVATDVSKVFLAQMPGTAGRFTPLATIITAVNSPTQIVVRDPAIALIAANTDIIYGTDDSAAINAAAQKARMLNFPPGDYVAPALDDTLCCECIFIGNNSRLRGLPTASRKIIVESTSGGPVAVGNTVIPEVHFPNLVGKKTATVVFCGDSHGTVENNFTSAGMISLLMSKFIKEFPSIIFTFYNYSIGGTSYANLNMQNNDGTTGWTPPTWPNWWTNHSNTWMSYIQAAAPDVVVPIRLTNEINMSSSLLISSVNAFKTNISAFTKVPNVLVVLEPCRSILPGVAAVNNEEQYAMYLRSFAMFNKWGLVDNNRLACQVREGFDPLSNQGYLVENLPNPFVFMPYTMPGPTRDYGIMVSTQNGTSGTSALAGWGNELQFTLSGNAGDIFYVGFDTTSTNLYYGCKCGGIDVIPKTVSNVSGLVPAGTVNFAFYICLDGTNVTVNTFNMSEPAIVYSGPVVRLGYAFTPVVSATVNNALNIGYLCKTTPRQTIPELTDTEFFGQNVSPWPATDYYGGDSGVHYGTKAVQHVIRRNLEALRFGPATDAAGNLRGNGLYLVGLPASTSYASDAAAATGGVAVGQTYRNGSVLQIRVS